MTFAEKQSFGFQTLNNWLKQRLGADNNQDPVDALASYLHSEAISFLKLEFHQDCEAFRVLLTLPCLIAFTTIYASKVCKAMKNISNALGFIEVTLPSKGNTSEKITYLSKVQCEDHIKRCQN